MTSDEMLVSQTRIISEVLRTNPMDKEFVAIVLDGVKRTIGRPLSQQNVPIMVERVVDSFRQRGSLVTHRSVLIMLLGFSGFLQFSELLVIRVQHPAFLESH